MRKKIYVLLLIMISVAVYGMAADKRFTLVIDAGHGGKDTGAPGKISVEKNINLKVALAFGKYVERNCPDVKVIYTRTTDVFVPLIERANIANRNKADLFISVHTNALDGGKISRGFETYTLGMHRAADNLNVAKRENSVILIEKNYKQSYAGFDPKSSESYIMFELMQDKNMSNSVELAKLIQNEVCSNSGRVNKGVHQAGFLVLRETSMPSCLIELGFITTADEEQYLNSAEGQDKMAQGIYNAFVKYKRKYGNAKNSAQNDQLQNEMNDNPLIADDGESEGGKTEYSEQRAVRQNLDAITAMATPATTTRTKENQQTAPASPPAKAPATPPATVPATPPATAPAQKPPSSIKTTAQTTTNPPVNPSANPPVNKPTEQKPATTSPTKPTTQNTTVATTSNNQATATTTPAPKTETPTTATNTPDTKPAEQTTAPKTASTPIADSQTKASSTTTTQNEEVDTLPEDMSPGGRPIFKVQIAATSQKLPTDSPVFMGVKGIECYTENNMTKYTVGASTDYEEIRQLRSSLAEKFPQSFIIAFRDGYKMEMWKALKEYKENLKKNKQ